MSATANGLPWKWLEPLPQVSRSLFGRAYFPALTALALRTYTRFAGAVGFRLSPDAVAPGWVGCGKALSCVPTAWNSLVRNTLAGILEQTFGVQVLTINEYDVEGVVFGHPDEVELDVIIKDGRLLICELRSWIDKAGMYMFERKARFYERRHQRQADRLIVVSPMIDAGAQQVAERLGIETYADSLEVATG